MQEISQGPALNSTLTGEHTDTPGLVGPEHQGQQVDPPSHLQISCEQATRYTDNLNGQVTLLEGRVPVRGSSALVYQGILRREAEEVKVAVKIFHSGQPGDTTVLKSILRVVHLWSKLHHQNIVGLLGITTDFGPTISIVSEWIGRGDAHTYVQDRGNDPQPLLLDIASALHYLHTREDGPIFHGDLKGANVLVSSDRRALLCDFGLSTLTQSSFSVSANSAHNGGSLPWMAPEVLDNHPISAASDIWSFGMTTLELFTCSDPYHGCKGIAPLIAKIAGGRLPRRPDVHGTHFRMTDAWWELCLSCWKHEPTLRLAISEVSEKIQTMISSGVQT
ncbi:hypothetical protein ID866_7619 [Astraeus odoratus]|nr:hypothetical protein ID866_7619 [Astraeus odoratus]